MNDSWSKQWEDKSANSFAAEATFSTIRWHHSMTAISECSSICFQECNNSNLSQHMYYGWLVLLKIECMYLPMSSFLTTADSGWSYQSAVSRTLTYWIPNLQNHQELPRLFRFVSSPQPLLMCGGSLLTSLIRMESLQDTQLFSPKLGLVPPMSTPPLSILLLNTLKVSSYIGTIVNLNVLSSHHCLSWHGRSTKIHKVLCKDCCINWIRKRDIV